MAKYSIKTTKEICKYVEEGLYQKDAAKLAGISEATLYVWIDEKPEFSELLEQAIAKYKHKLVGIVNAQAIKNGRLALEVLSRRWPNEYGHKIAVKQKTEHTIKAKAVDVREYAQGLLELADAEEVQQKEGSTL